MKKVIALCTALLLTVAITGCGNSAEESSLSSPINSSSENSTSQEKETTVAKAVVDPFENVAYYIPEFEANGAGKQEEKIYPNDLSIILDASESPFGSNMTFTYFLESADENEIIIKSRANIDEIEDFLEQSNYTVEVTEKTFSINVADLKTQLLSTDFITGDNKAKIISEMKNYIQECDVDRDEPSEYTLEKLYALVPDVTPFEVSERKKTSQITIDEESFEDKYLNTASIQVNDKHLASSVFGIFKNDEGNYYCIINNYSKTKKGLLFDKGIIDEDSLDFNIVINDLAEIDDEDFSNAAFYFFSDEKSAYEKTISTIYNMENVTVEEIPLS